MEVYTMGLRRQRRGKVKAAIIVLPPHHVYRSRGSRGNRSNSSSSSKPASSGAAGLLAPYLLLGLAGPHQDKEPDQEGKRKGKR